MTRQFWLGFLTAYLTSVAAIGILVGSDRWKEWRRRRRAVAELRHALDGDFLAASRIWEGQ